MHKHISILITIKFVYMINFVWTNIEKIELFEKRLILNTSPFYNFSTESSNIWGPRYICKVIKYSSAQMRCFTIASSPYLYGMETQ